MVKRIIAVLLIEVLAFGILMTAGSIGVRTVQYMTRQNFTIGNAVEWAWDDYVDMAKKVIGTTENNGTREIHIVVEDVKYLLKH